MKWPGPSCHHKASPHGSDGASCPAHNGKTFTFFWGLLQSLCLGGCSTTIAVCIHLHETEAEPDTGAGCFKAASEYPVHVCQGDRILPLMSVITSMALQITGWPACLIADCLLTCRHDRPCCAQDDDNDLQDDLMRSAATGRLNCVVSNRTSLRSVLALCRGLNCQLTWAITSRCCVDVQL